MIIVPRHRDHAPGTWKGLWVGKNRNRKSATFTCPNGHVGSLIDHDITREGYVHPSVMCMTDGCGFHEFIQLVGWSANGAEE